jgi:hypothetical protein
MMVKFFTFDSGQQPTPFPMQLLCCKPADMVSLELESRKYQPHQRQMPGRINTIFLEQPAQGLDMWVNMCMVTILQAWAIRNNVQHMSPAQRRNRAVLTPPGGTHPLTAHQVSVAMKRNANRRLEDPSTVMPSCLRTTAITALANSDVASAPHILLSLL